MFTVHTGLNPLREAGMAINRLLAHNQQKDLLILIPGGSAFPLANRIDPIFLSKDTTITLLDEYYTPVVADTNAAHLMTSPFWERIQSKNVHFIDPRAQGDELLDVTAKRWDTALRAWHEKHKQGVVIALMGIGVDGHTAGIAGRSDVAEMASFFALFESEAYVCGYTIREDDQQVIHRLTITNTYLRQRVDHAVVYVAGDRKHAALARIHNAMSKPVQTPASIMREMKSVHIYTDIHLTAEDTGKTLH